MSSQNICIYRFHSHLEMSLVLKEKQILLYLFDHCFVHDMIKYEKWTKYTFTVHLSFVSNNTFIVKHLNIQ